VSNSFSSSIRPSCRLSRGTSHFARRGTSHFAATGESEPQILHESTAAESAKR
jgi:hypothetical protein